VGGLLVAAAVEQIRKDGARSAQLLVTNFGAAQTPHLKRFYEGLGFQHRPLLSSHRIVASAPAATTSSRGSRGGKGRGGGGGGGGGGRETESAAAAAAATAGKNEQEEEEICGGVKLQQEQRFQHHRLVSGLYVLATIPADYGRRIIERQAEKRKLKEQEQEQGQESESSSASTTSNDSCAWQMSAHRPLPAAVTANSSPPPPPPPPPVHRQRGAQQLTQP
jgi:hypothetical protein